MGVEPMPHNCPHVVRVRHRATGAPCAGDSVQCPPLEYNLDREPRCLPVRSKRPPTSERPTTGEPRSTGPQGERDASPRSAGASGSPGLFKGHKSTRDRFNPYDQGQIEVWEGAALVKVTKQGRHEVVGESEKNSKPKRGSITGFSKKSRRRMQLFLAKVKLDEQDLPKFVTLTYPDSIPEDAGKYKRDLKNFQMRLRRRFPDCGCVWRLEFKRRKSGRNVGKVAPHFHFLLWGVPQDFPLKAETGTHTRVRLLPSGEWERAAWSVAQESQEQVTSAGGSDSFYEWVSRNWYEVVASDDFRHFKAGTNVRKLKNKRHVFAYVSKYMGKVDADDVYPFPGRFWGAFGSANIPLGNRIVIPCDGKQAAQVMRWQRNYLRAVAKRKSRYHNQWSSALICDADQWLAKLRIWLLG